MVRQTSQFLKGVEDMKRMLMAIMAVAIAVTFSAPSFAGEEKKDKKDEKKGGHVLVYGDEKKDKKDEKKGGHMDTFGDEKKKDEKKGGK
jgi:Ni/Co efflux regulator RcnB